MPEIGKLRSTWRELETRLWLPDCGPPRKRWNHHRRLPVRAPVLDPTCKGLRVRFPWATHLKSYCLTRAATFPFRQTNRHARTANGNSRCSSSMPMHRPQTALADGTRLIVRA